MPRKTSEQITSNNNNKPMIDQVDVETDLLITASADVNVGFTIGTADYPIIANRPTRLMLEPGDRLVVGRVSADARVDVAFWPNQEAALRRALCPEVKS